MLVGLHINIIVIKGIFNFNERQQKSLCNFSTIIRG